MAKHQEIKRKNKKTQKWALVGAPCSYIKEVAERIAIELEDDLSIIYYDEDHSPQFSKPNHIIKSGSDLNLNIKNTALFEQELIMDSYDVVLMNGNHFQAEQQIVIIHPDKEASVKKRQDQLTNIKAYILAEGTRKIYDFLPKEPPIIYVETISKFIKKNTLIPELTGLVLVGGQSKRMGENKALLAYHGMPQKDFCFWN